MGRVMGYKDTYDGWKHDPEGFWMQAAEAIDWDRKPTRALDDSRAPIYQWYADGRMNTCHNAVDRHVAAGKGERTAIIYDSPVTDTKRHISYSELQQATARLGGALQEHGVQAGDRVVIYMPMVPEAVIAMLACARIGAVHSVVFGGFAANELAVRIDDAKPKAIIAASCGLEPGRVVHYKPLLDGAIKQAGHKPEFNVIFQREQAPATLGPRDHDWDDFQKDAKPAECVPMGGADPLYILYTSGTTGRSKGAMLTQANLLSNAETLARVWRFTADDVLLHALPIFHTHGLFVATNVTLVAGGAMIFLPKFDLDTILAELPRATAMMGVPTFYTRLLGDDRFTRELVSHVRLFISGSAPLLEETHRAFEQRTGHRILERYGMTETNMNTSNPYDGERRAGTVGFPLPGVELKITDPETGKTLPDGEVGQIEVRGPNVFKGYWQMPEKTAQELRADGFFITGDLGRIDADGYVHIVGRNKDLIISGGYNIYPKEIELVLDEQPGVLESAVIGVPHPDFGETVLGVLVPKAGAKPDIEAIEEAVRGALARFKHPRELIVIDELPRNTMGKVQKSILRDRYQDRFAAV